MSATAVAGPITMPRMSGIKMVFSWIGLALVAFPLAGYAGWGVGGHVDDVMPALVGGAITGAGIGFVQWMFLRRDLNVGPVWILGTGVTLAVGLAVGSAVVGYETSTGQLAIMGAISGVPIGIVQGILLRTRFSLWSAWMVAMPALFALGWTVTASAGIDVDNQFTVFGAFGSIAFGLLTGLLMATGKRLQDGAE
ncbi:MAG TPA: hypothetical protein VE174_10625 [Actinomycetota bacterium]|nr:hypothetical protein [Actinomycetota bacterium]